MNNLNSLNAKIQAEKAYYNPQHAQCGQETAPGPSNYYGDQCCAKDARPSLRQEAEQRVGLHRAEADKADRAAAFFRENPAFDEFIQLIRSGTIQI